ncbi:hypothetical protein [Bifidobacterium aerophilum]|uniref:Uncharacterized protein n=1 Tax=Bifidobacterium aerophilum TaxID=1798155 RepID=A0A6N9Z7L4_9BIFI|nr:hypothetical protein [Bifidobacterium aerophilum]NEG90608.1 hypothetical protein [Bifidobacterium aerophilum]
MGRSVPHRPKILTLLHLWYANRPALQYDWIACWGGPWDPRITPARAAWPMLREILMDRSSHSFAALAGWAYIPDPADKYIHAVNQGASKLRRRPDWQRRDIGRDSPHPRAKDERLRSRLKARLGIVGTGG